MKSILVTVGLSLLALVVFRVGKYLYLKPKNITGDNAIEIKGLLPDGSSFLLSQLKGKYVLIDFWGSWCGPCRASHPQMVELYSTFKNQAFTDASGFEIVSIGIEHSKANWERAILSDQLLWPYHILESASFDSPVAKAYDVKQIPTKFLVNPDGVIMTLNPSMDQIAKLLNARLKATG